MAKKIAWNAMNLRIVIPSERVFVVEFDRVPGQPWLFFVNFSLNIKMPIIFFCKIGLKMRLEK